MTMKLFFVYVLVAMEAAWAFRLRPTPPPSADRWLKQHSRVVPREGGTVAALPNVQTAKGGSIDSSLSSQAAAHSDRSLDDAERALEQAGKVLASTARIRLPTPPNGAPPANNFVPTPPRTPPSRAQAKRAFEEAIKAFRQQSTDVRGRLGAASTRSRLFSAEEAAAPATVETVDMFGEGDGAAVNGSGVGKERRTRPPTPSNAGSRLSADRRDAFAAAIGGAALGAVAGVALDVALGQDLVVDFDTYVTTSATLGVALAAASAYVAAYPDDTDDGSAAVAARNALGGGSRAVGRAILGAVRSYVDGVVNKVRPVPGQIGTAIESRVENTVDEVRRTPDKIRAAATEASVRAVERIKETPRLFAESTRNVLQSGVNRIKGIPGQIGRAIEEKVEETVVEMKRTPDKIKAAATDASSVAVNKIKRTPVPPPVAPRQDNIFAAKTAFTKAGTPVRDSPSRSMSAPAIITPSPPKTKAPSSQRAKSPFFLSRRTREEEATIEATKLVERRKEEAARAVKKAEPGATISLFGFLFPKTTSAPKSTTPTQRGASGAPSGVPTISNWRRNRSGAIVGFVSESTKFEDGESITTSRIKGEAVGGTVVETVSGSRYFLEPPATIKSPISSLKNENKTGKTIAAELKRSAHGSVSTP